MREWFERRKVMKQIKEAKQEGFDYCFCVISFSNNVDWLRRKGFVVIPNTIGSGPDKESYEYTGSEIKPIVTVKDGDTPLTRGVDYTVEYSENINGGTGTVTVIGKGLYAGTETVQFVSNNPTSGVVGGCTWSLSPDLETLTLAKATNGNGDMEDFDWDRDLGVSTAPWMYAKD